jgi:hypothetical protein
MLGGTGGEVRCMPFGERDEALARWRQRLQGEIHNRPPQPSTFFLRECGMIVNLFLRWKVTGEDPADSYILHDVRKEGIAHGTSRSNNNAVGP